MHAGGFKPQFFPQLQGIMQLFQKPATAASLVVHLLAINLYLGRNIFLEGVCAIRRRKPTRKPDGLNKCLKTCPLRDRLLTCNLACCRVVIPVPLSPSCYPVHPVRDP